MHPRILVLLWGSSSSFGASSAVSSASHQRSYPTCLPFLASHDIPPSEPFMGYHSFISTVAPLSGHTAASSRFTRPKADSRACRAFKPCEGLEVTTGRIVSFWWPYPPLYRAGKALNLTLPTGICRLTVAARVFAYWRWLGVTERTCPRPIHPSILEEWLHLLWEVS